MYSCSDVNIERLGSPIEGEITDEKCKSEILENITFEKAISLTSAFGAVFRVRFKDTNLPFALKVIGDTQLGRNELRILCAIRKEILDKNLSPCFVRCDYWIACSRLSEVDNFGPSPLMNYGPNHSHLYFLLNVADYTLYSFPYEFTQYEIKCIIFELLYALLIGRRELKLHHANITSDNILVLETDIDRLYSIKGKQFRVSGKYMPLLIDFNTSYIYEMSSEMSSEMGNDVQELIDMLGHYINERIDLSNTFVSGFEELVRSLEPDTGRYDIKTIPLALQSIFFNDLNTRSTVSQRLSRNQVAKINTY